MSGNLDGAEPLEDLRTKPPKRRGRPRAVDGPTVTTTVRVALGDWEWAKRERLEFSACLRSKLHQLRIEKEHPPSPRVAFVQAARKAGFADPRITELLGELDGSQQPAVHQG